jgi:hypothetical protein
MEFAEIIEKKIEALQCSSRLGWTLNCRFLLPKDAFLSQLGLQSNGDFESVWKRESRKDHHL